MLIRPAEIRDGSGVGDGRGFEKHWGRALCYITVDRNIYWWRSISLKTQVNLQEITDACSDYKQYQITREEPITIDLESTIPAPNNSTTTAATFIADLEEGTVIGKLYASVLAGILINPHATGATTSSAHGAFVIEESNVDVNADDPATIRVTLRALGYGTTTVIDNANNNAPDICNGLGGGSGSSSSSSSSSD